MAEIIAGTYELKEKLGQGGGGVVYLARHLRLDKNVVLKADRRKVTTREELLRREVNTLKNLSHPYIWELRQSDQSHDSKQRYLYC